MTQQRFHRLHLSLPFGLLGLVGAWLIADYFRFDIADSDGVARGTLTLLVPSAGALLGLVLSARSVVRHRWATWAIAVCGTLCLGAIIGQASSPFGLSHLDGDAFAAGAGTSLAFLPVVVTMTSLARRVGRARAGSLLDEADRRAPWIVVATGVAIGHVLVSSGAAGTIYRTHSYEVSVGLGQLSVAALAVMFGLDLWGAAAAVRALRGYRNLRRRGAGAETTCDDVVDLGIGDDENVELAASGSAYRTNERPARIVRGSPAESLAALRRTAWRSGACCTVALVALATAHGMALTKSSRHCHRYSGGAVTMRPSAQ
jgi:hypothetical protein